MAEYNESQFSKVQIEDGPSGTYKDIKNQELPGCCFKGRIADFFLIGLGRACLNNVLPKLLTKDKKKKSDAFNISPEIKGAKVRSLVDREEFWNLFRVIAYAYNINQAGSDKNNENWKTSHHIITNGSYCTKIAEEYFKGGWTSPSGGSFKELVEKEILDDLIIQELQLYLEIEEDEEALEIEEED